MRIFAMVCILICITASLPSLTEGQGVDGVSIVMNGESRRTDLNGNDIIVAGIFHNITISLDAPSDDVLVKAYLEAGAPVANLTNTYSWSYNNDVWADDLYNNYYLNASASSRAGNDLHFNVAIDKISVTGIWRIVVLVGAQEEHNDTFLVEEPVAAIFMSAPTFDIRIIPYGSGHISSYVPGDPSASEYLTTRNLGNIPLDVTITYDTLNSLFGTTNSTGVWHPGEERTHYIDFQAQSWSPRKFQVKGEIHGEPRLLATPQTISCTVTPQTTFKVMVIVARQGYEVFQLDGITVQYKPLFPSRYKESLEVSLYVTGTSNGYLSVEGEKVSVSSVEYLDEPRDSPFLMNLRDDIETHILVNITCSVALLHGQSSMIAHTNFTVELDDFSDSGTFQNTIIVGAVSGGGDDDIGLGPPSMIAIAFIVITLVALVLFTWRTRRKTELVKRKELEDRIRKRKERSRRER